jgi:hypothetical protein
MKSKLIWAYTLLILAFSPSTASASRLLDCYKKTIDSTTLDPVLHSSEDRAGIAAIYRLPDKQKVEELKKLTWNSIGESYRDRILYQASVATNSYEIGVYIEMAAASRDPRWIKTLEKWRSEWKNVEKGWQTFLLPRADQALKELSSLQGPELSNRFGLQYWNRIKEGDYKSTATLDARKLVSESKINVTPHAFSRGQDHHLSQESIIEALHNGKVVSFETMDGARDTAVFRWVGQAKNGTVIRLIISMTDHLNVITASPTNIQEVRLYFHPDYTPKTEATLYRRLTQEGYFSNERASDPLNDVIE